MSVGYYVVLFGASFVGVFAGHSLIRAIFGTGSSRREEYQPVQDNPCMSESNQLAQCISLASKDISACQVYMNLLDDCQRKNRLS